MSVAAINQGVSDTYLFAEPLVRSSLNKTVSYITPSEDYPTLRRITDYVLNDSGFTSALGTAGTFILSQYLFSKFSSGLNMIEKGI